MGTTFDFEAYKRQCVAIAEAYKAWSQGEIDDQTYQAVIDQSTLVAAGAVAKIELEVIKKREGFRPIDAYQF